MAFVWSTPAEEITKLHFSNVPFPTVTAVQVLFFTTIYLYYFRVKTYLPTSCTCAPVTTKPELAWIVLHICLVSASDPSTGK